MRIRRQQAVGTRLSIASAAMRASIRLLVAPERMFSAVSRTGFPPFHFMKSIFIAALCLLIISHIEGQTGISPTGDSSLGTNGVQESSVAAVQRDANSCVWEWQTYQQGPDGAMLTNVSHYTEIASGLNHLVNGQWVESKDEIDILPDGTAAATNGQHQVYFPANIYNGVLEIVTADGEQLQSRPVGISYFDGTNSVLIAELTNSIGQVISNNEVIYTNAFTDFAADLLCTYRKSGFECDLIIRSQVPPPENFGLNSANTRLQLLTEFFNTPAPQETPLPTNPLNGLQDNTLSFGSMMMDQGKAFKIGTQNRGLPLSSSWIPVYKTWAQLSGRTVLIEELPYTDVLTPLQALPVLGTSSASASIDSLLHKVSASRLLPPARLVQSSTNTFRMASAKPISEPGVVLDYNIVNSQSNMTFQGDTTYLVNGTVNLTGVTTFEGGAVVKSQGEAITLESGSTITNNTGPYRPVVFTSFNDNSVGDSTFNTTNYTGNPSYTDVTDYLVIFSSSPVLSNMKFCYAEQAIVTPTPTSGGLNLWNVQFANVDLAVYAIADDLHLHNVLINQINDDAPIQYAGNANFTAENVTSDGYVNKLGATNYLVLQHDGTSVAMTNCLVTYVNPTNNALYEVSTDGVNFAASTNATYQAAGAGYYYLATNSPYRGAGTTNITPALLAELQQKTTYCPILYSNSVYISSNLTLIPQVPRDTNTGALDLGFHYDSIDYIVDNFWVTNACLTVNGGAVVATYNDIGVVITDGASITSVGTPLAPIWFTRYSSVQEQPIELGTGAPTNALPGAGLPIDSYHASNAPSGEFRFTKFSCPAGGGTHLSANVSAHTWTNLLVQDCEFWSGQSYFPGYNATTVCLKNNLFARSGVTAQSYGFFGNGLSASNNLFWYTSTTKFLPGANSNAWFLFNNSFDNSTIFTNSTQLMVNGYNAYLGNVSRLRPNGITDTVTNNSIPYQAGPLGIFYQPTNSILINTGSCTADLAGLYHYTTTTNQLKETNSIVDIGYHYIALNTNGLPFDSNGNGVPDYIEDTNGTGQGLTITLIAPSSGAYYAEPANPFIQASILDWQSMVTNVTLLAGTTSIDTITNTPYQYTWPIVPAGTYSLIGIALDAGGSIATSAPVSITVTNLCGNP